MIIQNINGTENGHSFVDLGLPSGLLWATCNVGADSPEQAGLYFAWGETTGFTAEQVKEGLRKFDYKSYKGKKVKSHLPLKRDAAHINMGGKWRMPTMRDFEEFIENTTKEWTEDYNGTGVAGRVFTSKTNGNSVFFPAAGGGANSSVQNTGLVGYYWASSCFLKNQTRYLYFASCYTYISLYYHCCGFSVRAVCER